MSPDQNPIENVWQLLKIKISKKKISTTRKLKAQLTKEWGQLLVQLAENLVNSMGRRVEALIESGGTLLCINYQDDNNINKDIDNTKGLLYSLNKIQKLLNIYDFKEIKPDFRKLVNILFFVN
ncbi:hypothetical protein C1646_777435 [Rhizophagus diaphanus]|nr:hypothetical protein C1646_777435 [Rhizophagus diaphanus] [Rhizophagus sp. MUCL 43196]